MKKTIVEFAKEVGLFDWISKILNQVLSHNWAVLRELDQGLFFKKVQSLAQFGLLSCHLLMVFEKAVCVVAVSHVMEDKAVHL